MIGLFAGIVLLGILLVVILNDYMNETPCIGCTIGHNLAQQAAQAGVPIHAWLKTRRQLACTSLLASRYFRRYMCDLAQGTPHRSACGVDFMTQDETPTLARLTDPNVGKRVDSIPNQYEKALVTNSVIGMLLESL